MGRARKFPSSTFIAIPIGPNFLVLMEIPLTDSPPTFVTPLPSKAWMNRESKLLVVGLLRGSFVFIADLAREIRVPVEIDFMTVSSYGNTMSSSQNVRILSDLNTDIKNVDVLLVEDIIDTGHTLYQVIKLLNGRRPNSLEVCCLLNKSSRRETNLDVKWKGFDIPDEFVVGYGIDYAQRNRNLGYIGTVRFN